MRTALPLELIDHVAEVAAHIFQDDPTTLARLCRVNRTFRTSARKQLYSSPFLDRHNINLFVATLEKDVLRTDGEPLTSLVRAVAFLSTSPISYDCDIEDLEYEHEHEHEHVHITDLLRCLSLVKTSVEIICVDMACSQVGCGWYTDPRTPQTQFDSLEMCKLRQLICRCPKGYLPMCTRKLLDLFRLGHSPSLVELLLYWTGPGSPEQSPDNAESLTKTLESCPNVRSLSIVEARPSLAIATRLDRSSLETCRLQPAEEVWVKSTSAGGAVFRLQAGHAATATRQPVLDRESDPNALGQSIVRAARRIDRRKNTLRAHTATIGVAPRLLCSPAPMAVVEVEGATHGDTEGDKAVTRLRAPSITVSRDEGWTALLAVIQGRRRSKTPTPPL